MPVQHQDLTIFDIDDDAVPLAGYGAVDGAGNVTTATFSTDPAHPRPYLKFAKDIGDSEVDFINGSSVIGQITAEIIDARRVATDQDTGIFTYLLATAAGDSALLGVRVVYRQQRTDGTWEVIFDGIGGEVTMPKLTTFKWQLRDARERERKMRAFSSATYTIIFPHVGPSSGWGYRTRYDAVTGWAKTGNPVMPEIYGLDGRVTHLPNDGLSFEFDYRPKNQPNIRDLLIAMTQPYPVEGDPQQMYFKDVLLEWSTDNLNWKQIVQPQAHAYGASMLRWTAYNILWPRAIIVGHVTDPLLRPANGATVYVRMRSMRAPSAEMPLFLQGNAGQILKDLYDGVYSPTGTTPVRYDSARMAEVILRAPFVQAKITESADDVRTWVQEHIYRVLRAAPAIRDGKVYPIFYDLPDATVALTQLDDSNTIKAAWKHGTERIVNQVIVEHERDIVPTNVAATVATLTTQKITIERNRLSDNSQRRHGTKPVTFKPLTLREIVSDTQAEQGLTTNGIGALFATKVQEELLRRFTNGAQQCDVECARTVAVDALREGDWVIMAVSWLPDYVTRERGINRLMQITRVGRGDAHKRSFVLLDAGPHDVPLAQPSLGVTTATDNATATIPVTAIPAGAQAEVQFALGTVQPATDSGEWVSLLPLEAAGDAITPSLVPGMTVWTRARSVADGRRPSAWTNPTSVALSAYAQLVEFDIDVVSAGADVGKPLVTWEQLTGTGGVRVYYERHDPGTVAPAPPYAAYVDVDASLESVVLPIVLEPFEQVSVYVHAYPGYAAGAVTGAVGAQSVIRTTEREDQPLQAPTVTVIDVSPTQRQLTITVKPANATIQWRIDEEGTDDWNENTNANGRIGYPTVPIVDVAAGDRVLETRTKLASGEVSAIRRTVLDADTNPEILSVDLQESPANTLVLNVGLDDDVVHYRAWARRGSWPTHDSTEAGTPLNENLIYDDNVEISTVTWYASGTGSDPGSRWYVIIRAYDEFWNFDQASAQKVVSGAPPVVGALSNVRVESQVHGDGKRYLDVLWDHNAEVQGTLHHVRILENGVEVVTLAMARDARLEHDGLAAVANVGGFHREKPAYDTNGEQLTFNYTVELYTAAAVLVGTYAASITSWFATGGGGGGQAPTLDPDDLTIENVGLNTVAEWTNPDVVNPIRIEWERSDSEFGAYSFHAGYNLAAGVVTHQLRFNVVGWVRFRVRYYNGYGNGPWVTSQSIQTPLQ